MLCAAVYLSFVFSVSFLSMTEKEGGGRAGGFRRPEKACKMAIKMKIKTGNIINEMVGREREEEEEEKKERDCNQHAPLFERSPLAS